MITLVSSCIIQGTIWPGIIDAQGEARLQRATRSLAPEHRRDEIVVQFDARESKPGEVRPIVASCSR